MSFKGLNILFKNSDDFFSEIEDALNGKKKIKKDKSSLVFDSSKAFWKFFTTNKLEILIAISKLRPESIYALAKMLGREPHHVLKDCNQLKFMGMINMLETDGGRKQIKPVLIFDYDFIRVDSPLEEVLHISSNANKHLLDAV